MMHTLSLSFMLLSLIGPEPLRVLTRNHAEGNYRQEWRRPLAMRSGSHSLRASELVVRREGGDGRHRRHDDRRDARILPRRREGVALAVVARVLGGQTVRPRAAVVIEDLRSDALSQALSPR
jgi:hypothetical protein